MSKHTPGSWIAVEAWVEHPDDSIPDICNCDMGVDRSYEEARANAHLIAAAPDLLEALVHAENALADYVPTIEKSGASLNYGHHVLRQARAAIAKATGDKHD